MSLKASIFNTSEWDTFKKYAVPILSHYIVPVPFLRIIFQLFNFKFTIISIFSLLTVPILSLFIGHVVPLSCPCPKNIFTNTMNIFFCIGNKKRRFLHPLLINSRYNICFLPFKYSFLQSFRNSLL